MRALLAALLLALPALPALPAQGAPAAAGPPPRRVISLAPSLTELLFALGAGDVVIGVTNYCNYPPAAQKLPKVGGLEDGSVDFERVLALRPDLVLAIGGGQRQTVESLRRLGLRVEVVPSQTVDDVFQAIARVGALLGRRPAAERLGAGLGQRMARVERAVAPLPAARRPRVFFELWDRPLMTASRSTLIGRLIELAGGVNIFADVPGGYPQVSLEAVLKRRPEIIVAPSHHAEAVDARSLAERFGLAAGTAPRERIVILDGDLISRAGPRIADALEILARALHPDLFPPRGAAAGPRGPR